MRKSLLIFALVLVVFSISFLAQVEGQVVTPATDDITSERETVIDTTFIDEYDTNLNIQLWDNYMIFLPSKKYIYKISSGEDFFSIAQQNENGEILKTKEFEQKNIETTDAAFLMKDDRKTSFADNKVILIFENKPEPLFYGMTIFVFERGLDGTVVNHPSIFIDQYTEMYEFVPENEKFDIFVETSISNDISDQLLVNNQYFWVQKVDVSEGDQEILINFEDNEMKELTTDVNQVMLDQYGFLQFDTCLSQIIDTANYKSVFSSGTDFLFFPYRIECYKHLRYFDSWYTYYKISASYGFSGFGDINIDDEHYTDRFIINTDYNLDNVETDNVAGSIRTKTYQFYEPFKENLFETVFLSTYSAEFINNELKIIGPYHGGGPASLNYETADDQPSGVIFYRDLNECLYCGIRLVAWEHTDSYSEWEVKDIGFWSEIFNGNNYFYPVMDSNENNLDLFKEVDLNTKLSKFYNFLESSDIDKIYSEKYFIEALFLNNFIYDVRTKIVTLNSTPWDPDIGELNIIIEDELGNIFEFQTNGDTFYKNLKNFFSPVSIKTTWHTIDLFERDICLESTYSKPRIVGTDIYGSIWAESKRTGIWDPVNEVCIFDSGTIPEEGGPPFFGWAAGPLGPIGNTIGIILLAVAIAGIYVYVTKFSKANRAGRAMKARKR